ncbi:hypothetical protein KAM330_14810 [Aeromonas hydrophila]|nr:hypothetical protein KAM330_14810 [Aeromonas hydrophila]
MLIIELNRLLPMGFLETQQAVVFGERVVTLPHATHNARTDVDACRASFCATCSGRWVGMVSE